MKKKYNWEQRLIKTASLSLKKTKSFNIDQELNELSSYLGLGGWTSLNKEFLLNLSNLTEREFDEKVWDYVLNLAKIKENEYSSQFRKFHAEKILSTSRKETIKKRMGEYIENKEYL